VTRVRPKGHSEYDASRNDATPNGMVTTKTKQSSAARPYPSARTKPLPKMNHRTFRRKRTSPA